MANPNVPSSPFKTILNFRDVGKTINRLVGSSILQEGKLFRSARLDNASSEDKATLLDTYEIKHIIDLRSKSEHLAAHKTHNPGPDSPLDLPLEPTSPTNPPRQLIQGLTYHLINLQGPAFERALFWKLKWSSMTRLVVLMAFGYRKEAIAVLVTEVVAPAGLLGLALNTLTHSQAEITEAFSILSQPSAYPVLIHCMQGKDRTGLIVALVLLLLGLPSSTCNKDSHADAISREAIEADYMASARELVPEEEDRLRELRAMGLGDDFAECEAGFVERVEEFLQDGWGGVEGYLDSLGVGKGERERVRECLIVDRGSVGSGKKRLDLGSF